MFDEDMESRKKPGGAKKNLADMSIGELEEYITELQAEIKRVEEDIAKKKASQAAAASVFKS